MTTSDQQDAPTHDETDWVLTSLVSTANTTGGLEVGVTLYVGGSILAGKLISRRAYFEAVAEKISESTGNVIAEALAGQFREIAEEYRELEKKADRNSGERTEPGAGDGADREDDDGPVTTYIHLKDTHVFTPGAAATIDQGLWRGRLTAVDGWTLGILSSKSGS